MEERLIANVSVMQWHIATLPIDLLMGKNAEVCFDN